LNYSFSSIGSIPLDNLSGGTQGVKAEYLIKNFVIQIDDKIILACFLCFVGYFLAYLVIPRSIKGLKVWSDLVGSDMFKDLVRQIIFILERLISLFETFAIGSGVFIIGLSWYQGLIKGWMKISLIVIVCLAFLIFIAEGVGYIRNKKYQNIGLFGGSDGKEK